MPQTDLPTSPESSGFVPLSRASDIIRREQERIASQWERAVREQISESRSSSSIFLRNSLSKFLAQLADSLALPRWESGKSDAFAQGHGYERAAVAGYFLPQLLCEYSLLRKTVLEILVSEGGGNFEDIGRINESIDAAMSAAATEFTKTQEAQVHNALRHAEESNVELDHFATVAAHDLKAPLATLTGYLDLIKLKYSTQLGTQGEDYINTAKRLSGRMLELIEKLLDYARISNDSLDLEVIELQALWDSTLEDLEYSISETNAEVTSDPLPRVEADGTLLEQVFQNLVANSLKFRSTSNPRIHLGVMENPQDWILSLKDNGVGFDPKYKEEIFSIYRSLAEPSKNSVGIGLATCRKILELHGGAIWAESSPGDGATFYLRIPKSRVSKDKNDFSEDH